jgi:hypothetical protein
MILWTSAGIVDASNSTRPVITSNNTAPSVNRSVRGESSASPVTCSGAM